MVFSLLSVWAFLEISDRVFHRQTRKFDTGVLTRVQDMHSPLLDLVMKGFSLLGGVVLITLLCLGLGVWFLTRRQMAELKTLVCTALGGTTLNLLIKDFFARDRPDMWAALVHDDLNTSSYPSGHATISLVVYGFLAYILSSQFPRWRGLILLATVVLVLAIGWSRLYVGLHWPTDVLAGYAAGFAWLSACLLTLEVYRKRQRRREGH
ncbi:phosphatase PAP2 family protein [Phormidium sp. CCY1219]|uniref:phosphatase PAP2 family protein n=1 Tax=Phormidium sp. CCY1219 TaxID=2886104 RepID=UPI002D1ED21E|nr:phosphatase PAP2 family protein [Phormidium sp. CCY1219]MEB3826209.1 phosphatase PAP2 family protein [Phormidium sp. CCY1219]